MRCGKTFLWTAHPSIFLAVTFQRLGQELTADWLGTAVDYKETFHSVCSLFLDPTIDREDYLGDPIDGRKKDYLDNRCYLHDSTD